MFRVSCLPLTISLFAFVALTGPASFAAERPNIVLIIADDLGYGELGCQGNDQIPTPNIDSLAAGGVRLTSGYVTASYCSPSRAGLLTGRYQLRFGYTENPTGAKNEDPDIGLPPSEVTLAEHLQDAGYVTGLFGKWHLGGTAAYHPLRTGFDEFFGFLHEGHYYVPPPYKGVTTMLRRRALPDGGKGRMIRGDMVYSTHLTYEPDYDANNPIIRGGQPEVEEEYLTDAITREAVDFIDRHRETPFFMYLSYNAVHSPLQGAEEYMERFAHIEDIHRRIFAAMLSNLDDGVGAVLDKLRAERLEENTLIFFISDNGGPTRELTSSNLPLRGGKGDLYEGGIRVPFIVQWKGRLPEGTEFHKPATSLDVFPTVAAATGVPITGKRAMDGVNLLPYLSGENDARPHDLLFWKMGAREALRSGDWKLVQNARRSSGPSWELYNLADDLREANDLAGEKPGKVAELAEAYRQIEREMKGTKP